MGDWQPIKTAPLDGTPIQARIPGHGDDNVIAFHMGLIGENGEDCGGWCFVSELELPNCWTDGVCWAANMDGMPSAKPTHWTPLCKMRGDLKLAPIRTPGPVAAMKTWLRSIMRADGRMSV